MVRSDACVCLRSSAVHLRYEQGFAAVDRFVKSDMKVGLGTGSTAAFVVQRLGELLRDGKLKNVVGVPTSEATRKLAEKWNIPLVSLNDLAEGELLDVCIDGADEVLLPELLLIKGRGGALLREKIVAAASKTFVVVGDSSKVIEESRGMGLTGALPVEVISFFSRHVQRCISALPTVRNCCSRITIRRVSQQQQQQKQQQQQDQKTPHPSSPQHLMKNNEDMNYYVTDNGNHIVDLFFEKPIADPHALNRDLLSVIGVVETGLFLNMTSSCVIAYPDGSLQTLQPAAAAVAAAK